MTAAAPTVKDQELMPFGLVESAGVCLLYTSPSQRDS